MVAPLRCAPDPAGLFDPFLYVSPKRGGRQQIWSGEQPLMSMRRTPTRCSMERLESQ